MLPRSRIIAVLTCIIGAGIAAGCCRTAPDVTISPAGELTLHPGESIPLTADAQGCGPGFKFDWAAQSGKLNPKDQSAAQYTAPTAPGDDIAAVTVTGSGGPIVKHIIIHVRIPAILTPIPSPGPTSTPNDTQTPTLTLTPSPTPTITITPTPTAHVIVDASPFTSWQQDSCSAACGRGNGASIIKNVKSAEGKTGEGVEINFDIKKSGYVILTKNIEVNKIVGTKGVSFYYKGHGANNTIEFKLMLHYPYDGEDTTYGVRLYSITNTDDVWQQIQIPYDQITCWWPAANCLKHGNEMDLSAVLRIDYAISNAPTFGGVPGEGTVVFDSVWSLP